MVNVLQARIAMLLIGIDEAGYGPKIGPLCHGYCAFRSSDTNDGAVSDLWQLLHPSVMRHPARPGSITVDDSKKIYSSAQGLQLLQRGVRAFLECMASSSIAQNDLTDQRVAIYQALLPECDRAKLEEDAWGCLGNESDDLPANVGVNDQAAMTMRSGKKAKLSVAPALEHISLLRETLNNAGVSVVALGARAMSAKYYNAALAQIGNKADVSWNIILAEFVTLLKLARPGEHIHITIDRQSGRKFYASRISTLFPDAFTWIEVETQQKSVYRIEAPDRVAHVAFMVAGDRHSLPVALGSMAAKLIRELCMQRFNAFFRSHDPNLKPTAGYYCDTIRFLKETQSMRKRLVIQNHKLVRVK
ncbi:MAG: hypothetical protein V1899_08070 [Planctomycetota bacterium]